MSRIEILDHIQFHGPEPEKLEQLFAASLAPHDLVVFNQNKSDIFLKHFKIDKSKTPKITFVVRPFDSLGMLADEAYKPQESERIVSDDEQKLVDLYDADDTDIPDEEEEWNTLIRNTIYDLDGLCLALYRKSGDVQVKGVRVEIEFGDQKIDMPITYNAEEIAERLMRLKRRVIGANRPDPSGSDDGSGPQNG